ncbi:putative zinc-type alcohol dehydrogenase-like protein YjmD [Thalassoglobus neptunius]|uniref:Putative zinc-type alcohol dehydrogenase-like protein YjmD n=1 Tax=Thalassoglobus neptunius TaxID=1938619 RepID=A0A5C5VVV4_9PLAN|nr:glucose 1-dehydrogenase [Thalassoglobus neptunius]TWT41652.1 putative zinc-type alcohol dehydrogenase-like protein YjmD [Thalassoglobus neptunius]
MKALAVTPGRENSAHVTEIPEPRLDLIPGGRGVLMKTLQVGVDATDSEINEGLYGQAPQGDNHLVIGHEFFGIVEAVGENVTNVQPGEYCSCTVRRPGPSLFDKIGRNDITSHDEYYERGINLRHGFMTEKVVDDCEFVVKVPVGLKKLGVLAEPVSVCAKAIEQAYLAQTRLQVWKPRLAFVTGAGQIGLLTAMMLRLRGLEVYVIARTPNPGLKEEIANGYGAEYVSTQKESMEKLVSRVGAPDLVIEATGSSRVAFDAMRFLARNGALVWTSVTGGKNLLNDFPSDSVNLEWVLGNKLLVGSVNGNRDHFNQGIADLALAEVMFPGVTERILTTPIDGFDNPEVIMDKLSNDKSALKVYVDVASAEE